MTIRDLSTALPNQNVDMQNITNTNTAEVSSIKDIDIIKAQDDSENVLLDENNNKLKTELSIQNFKKSIEKEFGDTPLNIIIKKNENSIKNRFESILKKMSVEDLAKNFNTIMKDFSDCPELIDLFFCVFKSKDENKARELADTITFKDFKTYNSDIQCILVKYRSIPGTENLRKENEEHAKLIYQKHSLLIEELFNSKMSEEERNKRIKELPEGDTKNDVLEYCKCLDISVIITTDAIANTEKYSVNPDAAQNIIEKNNKSAKELPGYKLFLEKVAKFISNNSDNEFNIDKKKLNDLLDKISDKKFSETIRELSEKSATDETGNFKTVSKEVINKSEEKIQTITQGIEEASKPEPIVVEAKNNKTETSNIPETGTVSYETITGDDGVDIIKDIFTGKIKVSDYLEQVAIKKYKLMNTAMQGNILLNATGEFFDDLVQTLKTSTFEHLLSIGWKGRSYDATQKVKNEVEKRKNNVA